MSSELNRVMREFFRPSKDKIILMVMLIVISIFILQVVWAYTFNSITQQERDPPPFLLVIIVYILFWPFLLIDLIGLDTFFRGKPFLFEIIPIILWLYLFSCGIVKVGELISGKNGGQKPPPAAIGEIPENRSWESGQDSDEEEFEGDEWTSDWDPEERSGDGW